MVGGVTVSLDRGGGDFSVWCYPTFLGFVLKKREEVVFERPTTLPTTTTRTNLFSFYNYLFCLLALSLFLLFLFMEQRAPGRF